MFQDVGDSCAAHTAGSMQARRTVQAANADPASISADARYLLDVLAKLKITANKLADEIGVPASTLSRHVPKADGSPKDGTPRSMHAEVRAKIETYSGIPAPSAVLANSSAATPRRMRGFAEEVVPFDYQAPGIDRTLADVIALLVQDRPGAAAMQVKTRALEDAGYRVGDIVIVEQGVEPRPGQAVCAQVYDRHGGAETVLRIYRTAGPVRLLFASLADPSAEALLIDDEHVKIMAAVTESFRPRAAA